MLTDAQLQEIGKRIRDKRKEMSLTQEKAAELLDISLTHYKNIEHGRSSMSLDMLTEICDKMDLEASFVLNGKEMGENPIIEFYNSLPKEKRHFFNRAMYYIDRLYEE